MLTFIHKIRRKSNKKTREENPNLAYLRHLHTQASIMIERLEKEEKMQEESKKRQSSLI